MISRRTAFRCVAVGVPGCKVEMHRTKGHLKLGFDVAALVVQSGQAIFYRPDGAGLMVRLNLFPAHIMFLSRSCGLHSDRLSMTNGHVPTKGKTFETWKSTQDDKHGFRKLCKMS